MATPAQVANDMAAYADFWLKRDKNLHADCRDAARLIRAFLNGQPVDGRTYGGVHRRLSNRANMAARSMAYGLPNFDRALATLIKLRADSK